MTTEVPETAAPAAAAPTGDQQGGGAATAVATPEVTTVGKAAKAKSGDIIVDTAQDVEKLTKVKALHEADRLAEGVDTNNFRLGGVLKLISDNSWFEGYETFDKFVYERYGFAPRKASYLMSIYTNLVQKAIPWEKVAGLGWTKVKELASIITLDNVDDWVAKASKLTVLELQALIKAGDTQGGSEGTSATTTEDIVKLKFNVKNDQAETIKSALAKAKGELGTTYDTVAFENICAGYLAGNSGLGGAAAPAVSLQDQIKALGMEAALGEVDKAFPGFVISVDQAPAEAAA